MRSPSLEAEFQQVLTKVTGKCYRVNERDRIVASLLAGEGVYVVGDAGYGKSTLAQFVIQEIRSQGFLAVLLEPGTLRDVMESLAVTLGLDTETLDGKSMSSRMLQEQISDFLEKETVFFIVDDAPSVNVHLRRWLNKEHEKALFADRFFPIVLFGRTQPEKDILNKFPALELDPLSAEDIKDIMETSTSKRGGSLSQAEIAQFQQESGGCPAIANKVVAGKFLGIRSKKPPEHKRFFDLTPFVLLPILLLSLYRYAGRDPMQFFGASAMVIYVSSRVLMKPSYGGLGGRK
ncbi:MAG: AAA family ATPase [Xenococcaceae cyanobacterium]